VDEVPGFDGVADLLPTNLLRGFFAVDAALPEIGLHSSPIECG